MAAFQHDLALSARGAASGIVTAISLALSATASEPVTVAVPSGQTVTMAEILSDENPGALWLRFRFVAPGIARDGGEVSHEIAIADIDWICANLALPYIEQQGLTPARVVISMADRAVPFAVTDATATQFFATYRTEDGLCIWEEF